MKKIFLVLLVFLALALLMLPSGVSAGKDKCTTIQDGTLLDSAGNPLVLGYDQWGYNYQAHIYNGFYSNYTRPDPPVTEDDTWLQMKWNDAWLSNKSCDDDDLLDRHYGFDSYIGSGAWLTNHQSGDYEQDGQTCKWNYYVKIVAAPADATKENNVWYAADGTKIGPVIWGEFAIVQQVENDPCAGIHGVQYVSPDSPGLGKY